MTEFSPLVEESPTKPRITIRAGSRPSQEPIAEALIKGGLITQEEADKALSSGEVGENQTETPMDQSLSEPPLDINPGAPEKTRVERRQHRHKRRAPAQLAPPTRIDPQDIPDQFGYTPRMKAWMGDEHFGSLIDILAHQRPMGSKRETEMLEKHIYPLAREVEGAAMTEDRRGNIIVDIGDNAAGVLWSCHTDTVHPDSQQGLQKVSITPNGYLRLQDTSYGCLGADDGAGIWIMVQMIRARVPGRYVFHYGEERGCHGSRHIAEKEPWVLEGMRFAIAFDRHGTTDVVTRQGGRVCCSMQFVDSIVPMLPPGYSGAPGVWTDTGVYIDAIPECSNLSVGYSSQHSGKEILFLPHLYALRDAMLRFDASRLVCGRDPTYQRIIEDRMRREQEERSRFTTGTGNFLPLARPVGQTRSPSSATIGTPEQDIPAILEALSPEEASEVTKMAIRFEWSMLNAKERRTMMTILGAWGDRRYEIVRNWLKRHGLTDQQKLKREMERKNSAAPPVANVSTSNVHPLTGSTPEEKDALEEYYSEDEYDEGDGLSLLGGFMPPKPRSLLELIKAYPNELCDVMEQEGLDVDQFWSAIIATLR